MLVLCRTSVSPLPSSDDSDLVFRQFETRTFICIFSKELLALFFYYRYGRFPHVEQMMLWYIPQQHDPGFLSR